MLTGLFRRVLSLKLYVAFAVFCALFISSFTMFAGAPVKPVKYVFLFIGDGMAPPQRAIAEEYAKLTGHHELLINKLDVHGFTTTHANNSVITDSAAAGTAIACGVKTNNGVLGLDAQMKPVDSVAKVAHDAGRKVGIITNVPITHATPAAFYAHTRSRSNGYDIGLDLVKSEFDFFAGGNVAKAEGKKGNIYELAKQNGYIHIDGKDAFMQLDYKPDNKFLITYSQANAIDKSAQVIALKDLTAKAIEILDNPAGFFIMVEGGRIDWACHANDAPTAIYETLSFDSAVKVAYEFARKHPDDTLIVVTGDHETGGLTAGLAGTGYTPDMKILTGQKCSAGAFASAVNKGLKYKNNPLSFDAVKDLIIRDFGLKFSGEKNDPLVLTQAEVERLKQAYDRALALAQGEKRNKNEKSLYGSYNPIAITVSHILSAKAGFRWDTFGHSAMPVQTSAFGSGKELFKGKTDNVDIGNRLKLLVGKIN
jgi:alkaline phosphatase